MELTVLGSGGGWAPAGGAACGYLLRHEGFSLWVDLGTGTMANLQRHVDLDDVGAVAVSHRHFDHFLDMYPFFLARWYGTGRPPIPLFAPPGMFEHALQLEEKLGDAFGLKVVKPGETFETGPFKVRTASMRHPVPTLGMRFEADGRTLAYSADTGPTEDLARLAAGTDVLLAEATWLDRPEGWDFIHMTASEAGELARRAEVGRLVLTHIWPRNPKDVVQDRAEAAFGSAVTLAVEGMTVAP